MDRSPCVHQAAVVKYHHSNSLNFIPTLNPSVRRDTAIIALGDEAQKDLTFYSSLHQQKDEQAQAQDQATVNPHTEEPDFSASCWDLIRASAQDEPVNTLSNNRILLINNIDTIARILKDAVIGDDQQLFTGTKKLKQFMTLSSFASNAWLISALHCFGSEPKGTSVSIKSGLLRSGKRIKVQATATGRRKFGTKGRGLALPGRPCSSKMAKPREKPAERNQVKQKRPHLLSANIKLGRQNAGKW